MVKKRSPNNEHNFGRAFMSESAKISQPSIPAGNQGDFGTLLLEPLHNQVTLNPSVLSASLGRNPGCLIKVLRTI